MFPRKAIYIITALVIVLLAILLIFTFPSGDRKKRDVILTETGREDSRIENPKAPLKKNHSSVDLTHNETKGVSPGKSIMFAGVMIESECTTLYSTGTGKVQYSVVPGNIIHKGDELARLITADKSIPIETAKTEILSQESSIRTAYQDIENLTAEIELRNAQALDLRTDYLNAQIDYDYGRIDKEEMEKIKEVYLRAEAHLEDTKKMLEGKYTAIEQSKERISVLESMITGGGAENDQTIAIFSPFTGRVVECFFNNLDTVDENAPLLSVSAANVGFIKCRGKLPFSSNFSQVALRIPRVSFNAQGELRILGYICEDEAEITTASIVFQKEIVIEGNWIGEEAVLSIKDPP